MYGDQFPRYSPECVAQLPLSGKDHIVEFSNLKFSNHSENGKRAFINGCVSFYGPKK